MRSLRTLMAAAWILGIAPGFADAQTSPAPKDLLKFRPTQKGVEYDTPSDASAIAACKVETVMSAKKHVGYALRDGQGKLLRRFVDINGNGVLDQWSYYQDGFEVYRESDLNDDKSLDECRWMNAAGTRIATVSGTRITGWKRLSAEEASKVLVQALVWGDLPLLETVLAVPDELSTLGLPKPVIEQTAAASARRVEQIKALQKDLKGWTGQTVWNRLDAMLPHLIPADAGAGQDVLLYENVVIFAGAPNEPINPKDVAFLQAPEMVKVGESWKFVELPRAVDPSKPIVAAEGIVRAAIYGAQGAAGGPDSQNPALDEALRALAKFDAEHVNDVAKKDVAQFHVGRIPLLRAVIKVARPEDQLGYTKQVADSLAAAYQTGLFPKGLELLDALIGEDSKIASYAAFRKISTEFAAANEEPGANPLQNQKKWMAGLKAFLDRYPKADEAPDALLQLASSYEFNAEEDEARKYYEQLARDFPETDPGQKGIGVLRRLDLVGKSLPPIKATGLKNEIIDTEKFRGKPLLVTFWATWADPVKRDLPELTKVYQKHHDEGFEILGISLDNDRADLDAFLKKSPLPWPQVFEPGGLEKNRLATEFGIIALPTMILVDPQGKVVNRNLRTAAELERQLEKLVAGKDGVALEAR